MGDEDESERERGGNIPGQELIGVDRSCVRTGSDIYAQPYSLIELFNKLILLGAGSSVGPYWAKAPQQNKFPFRIPIFVKKGDSPCA